MTISSAGMLDIARQHQAAIAEQLGWARHGARPARTARPRRTTTRRHALRMALVVAGVAGTLAASATVIPSIPARHSPQGPTGQVVVTQDPAPHVVRLTQRRF
jgi:ferric-dicitrate binding protein FerR (iron transport regulator)